MGALGILSTIYTVYIIFVVVKQNVYVISKCMGFLGSSAGTESTCSAGYPGVIPELGRCPGEGIGYPLQYSWASLVAQMVKNPPAMRET